LKVLKMLLPLAKWDEENFICIALGLGNNKGKYDTYYRVSKGQVLLLKARHQTTCRDCLPPAQDTAALQCIGLSSTLHEFHCEYLGPVANEEHRLSKG
jgi:hypothetical protein